MQRSAFLAASAALTFAPALVRSQTLTTVTVASAPNDDLLGTLWALETGTFRKAGLDVQLQKANTGSAVAAAVAGGAINIGKSSLVSLLIGRSKNFPFVLVASAGIYTAEGPTAGMVTANDSPIKTGKDCNGKIMGVGALNDLTALGTQAWVDSTGGDSTSLRYVELPASAIAEAVAAGRVAAGTMPNPQFGQSIVSGKVRLLAYCVSAIARRFVQAAYFTSADYLTKNRETVATFRRTVEEAAVYANAHRDQMVPVLSKFTGVEPRAILAQPQQILGTALDIRLIQPLVDVMVKYKAVPSTFEARTMLEP